MKSLTNPYFVGTTDKYKQFTNQRKTVLIETVNSKKTEQIKDLLSFSNCKVSATAIRLKRTWLLRLQNW